MSSLRDVAETLGYTVLEPVRLGKSLAEWFKARDCRPEPLPSAR